MALVLLVDDDPGVLSALQPQLQSDSLTVWTAASAGEALAAIPQQPPDVVLLDVHLPDLSGLDVLTRMQDLAPGLPVILFTGCADMDMAAEAMKRGAFGFLCKPLECDELRRVIDEALAVSRRAAQPGRCDLEAPAAPDGLVGCCAAMLEVFKAVGRVAPQDVPVLLLGESGTGKELVARAIHRHSSRHDGPFLALNCAAGPETLLESELFGHEKGAFTGADRRHVGKFERCHGGALFLDEIGELSLGGQAKLLRVLQERQFERIGGDESIKTDVRLIAATNKDLARLVQENRFREDLLYRLNVFPIRLPPLRERGDDLRLLIDHFLRVFSRQFGKEVPVVPPEARRLLEKHSWAGNVRELQNVLQSALLHAPSGVLTASCVLEALRQQPGAAITQAQSAGDGTTAGNPATAAPTAPVAPDISAWVQAMLEAGETGIYHRSREWTEREVLRVVLRHTRNNQVQAAALLGLARNTLRAKLRALNQNGGTQPRSKCAQNGAKSAQGGSTSAQADQGPNSP
jgi:two-component system nitrogen regulation response regulator GlnG